MHRHWSKGKGGGANSNLFEGFKGGKKKVLATPKVPKRKKCRGLEKRKNRLGKLHSNKLWGNKTGTRVLMKPGGDRRGKGT